MRGRCKQPKSECGEASDQSPRSLGLFLGKAPGIRHLITVHVSIPAAIQVVVDLSAPLSPRRHSSRIAIGDRLSTSLLAAASWGNVRYQLSPAVRALPVGAGTRRIVEEKPGPRGRGWSKRQVHHPVSGAS